MYVCVSKTSRFLSDPPLRCTCGSCCVSCCPASTSTSPGWGRTASSCSSAIAGSCSASNESSPTRRLCACGRPAGHTTRSGQSLNCSFAYTSLWEELCINECTEAFVCSTTAPNFVWNKNRACVIRLNPVTTDYCNPLKFPLKCHILSWFCRGFMI